MSAQLPPPGQRTGLMRGWSLEDRFEAYIVRGPVNECWPWTGEHTGSGYASLRHNGRRMAASRVSWSLHHQKPFPANLQACHECDNPGCVNPHHIWPGTNNDNIADSVAKGRRKNKNPKSHCKRGHAFAGENLIVHEWRGKTMRRCRECERTRSLASYHKLKSKKQ